MRQTIRVHRLVYLAYKRGGMALQQRLLALLFRDFFEQPDPFTIDVTSVPQLAAYAVEIGLIPDRAAAEAWLNSRAFTVVEGKWAIGGGMERGIYYKTLERLITATEETPNLVPTLVEQEDEETRIHA